MWDDQESAEVPLHFQTSDTERFFGITNYTLPAVACVHPCWIHRGFRMHMLGQVRSEFQQD